MKVSLFIPCFIDQCFPAVGISVVRILERLGHAVDYPTGQTCCGQPAFNSGAWEQARAVARQTLAAFRHAEIVVTPSGFCGAMMKVFYRELFKGFPEYAEVCALGDRTWEFSSFLVNKLGVTDLGASFPGRATFHDGCHGLRELRVRSEPRALLKHVRGLELVEMKSTETCCGFGGTFAVKFPMISTAMGEAKCAAITETRADCVISLDSSCLMHLQGMFDKQRAPMRSLHLAEVCLRRGMNTIAASFNESATAYCHDLDHRQRIQKALTGYEVKRDEYKARFLDWEIARETAAAIKFQTINHLDVYLAQFAERLEARGGKVHWARDAREAREIIAQIARDNHVHHIIKSKSMTSEEIHLNEHLGGQGFDVFESDLGEFIVQLRHEAPYHLVFPSMHLTRKQISETFVEKLGAERVTEPQELTMIARRLMRQKFCQADMGISGVNFGVAETGMISITENEGNARLTTALPRIHVALMGIEKMLPRLEDLALFLPLLATAGAGQPLTCYNSVIGGPRLPGEPDGPEQFHVVLLDNGRTTMLADAEQRDSLHCIRCGACLNVCPIFRNVGGHTYGTVYGGPIGSVITPHLRGLSDWKHLSFASSLCGACTEACPVKIDLAHHLLRNRRNAVQQEPPFLETLLWRAFAFFMQRPRLYRLAAKMGRLVQPLHSLVKGTALDPVKAWTKTREAPKIADQSFTDWWNRYRRQRGD